MKRKIKFTLIRILKFFLLLEKPSYWSSQFYERINLIHISKKQGKEFKIKCPNELNYYRATTYFTKEPDMIEWIDSFDRDDVLFDVGANIGLYSIYAAKQGIKKVVAIEPHSLNYSQLNDNIYLNNCQEIIDPLCLAISNNDKIENLYIPNFISGAALNNLGNNVGFEKREFDWDHKQSVLSMTLDNLVKHYSKDLFPTKLKIDVDGNEALIIEGSENTLEDERLNSILIELNENLEEDMDIVRKLDMYNFKVKSISQHVETGEFKDIKNYLFVR